MTEILDTILSGATAFLRLLSDPAPKLDVVADPRGRGGLVAAVRSDYKLERLAGPELEQRTHTFHDLGSYADWLKRWAKPGETEILVGETQARALLRGTEAVDPIADVTCKLLDHPTFAAWKGAFGVKRDPKQFHAFIRSVAATFDDGNGGVNTADFLSGELAKLKAVKSGEINSSVDPRGFYAVSGATSTTQVDAKIPPSFTVRSPIFVGIPDPENAERERLYALEILLAMDVESNGILFTLTCPALPAVLHQARLDAVAHLRALLGEGFLVGLGDIATTLLDG